MSQRSFGSLHAEEILALAASLEEEHARVFGEFARHLEDSYPQAAQRFRDLRDEEQQHHERLTIMLQKRCGDSIPYVRRDDVTGFIPRVAIPQPGEKPVTWYERQSWRTEVETERFYLRAAARTQDPEIRLLLSQLAEVEAEHERRAADALGRTDGESRHSKRELFILQVVQPGLVGLMDGSVSTLAPVFAAALATGNPMESFLIGFAASLGAGISMGIAEGMSDDGSLTGRGRPLLRGAVSGVMTFVGGIGHALPFLIPNMHIALLVAIIVTVIELFTISWIRQKYMDTPFWRSALQVVVGGAIVVATGVAIGNAG